MNVVKIDTTAKKFQKIEDYVAEEKLFHIFINRTRYASMLCTPKDLKELAVGHLISEGAIKAVDEIEKITIKEKGICYINLKPAVNLQTRLKLAQRFSRVI
ncbi:MAG: formate dehydrogenase accessory sulfurtransferase FdhD, partial [Candidatus Bathyarchaeia archaeon]